MHSSIAEGRQTKASIMKRKLQRSNGTARVIVILHSGRSKTHPGSGGGLHTLKGGTSLLRRRVATQGHVGIMIAHRNGAGLIIVVAVVAAVVVVVVVVGSAVVTDGGSGVGRAVVYLDTRVKVKRGFVIFAFVLSNKLFGLMWLRQQLHLQ
jgi:hypothetical protein